MLKNKPLKIAIVDDSQIMTRWLEANLLRAGFEVESENSSHNAEEFIRRFHPDVLLLDVLMPGLSGDDLCKMLKENPATRDITIILVSNIPEENLKTMTAQCSADGYIFKTDSTEELTRNINKILAAAVKKSPLDFP